MLLQFATISTLKRWEWLIQFFVKISYQIVYIHVFMLVLFTNWTRPVTLFFICIEFPNQVEWDWILKRIHVDWSNNAVSQFFGITVPKALNWSTKFFSLGYFVYSFVEAVYVSLMLSAPIRLRPIYHDWKQVDANTSSVRLSCRSHFEAKSWRCAS